jgi:hypothetical protein
MIEATRFLAYIAAGTAIPQPPCAPSILSLLRQGILASPYTPHKILRFCKRVWNE